MRAHVIFLSSDITWLVTGIAPLGFFPRTPSFYSLSFVDSRDPLTRHSYLLHILPVFVGKRGLTGMQSVPLPSTYSSTCLSSSVSHYMRRCPIHLPGPAYRARRSPLIYPANRIWSDGRPRSIQYYKTCSNDPVLWGWDTTIQSASDVTPSKPRGWRAV